MAEANFRASWATGIAFLSLAAFFALRRLSLSAVTRMRADNARLTAILDVSRELSGAPHLTAAAQIATTCALRIAGGAVAYLLREPEDEKGVTLCDVAGEGGQALFTEREDEILDLGRIGCRAAEATVGCVGDQPACVLPIRVEGARPAAFVLVLPAGPDVAHPTPDVLDALETLARLTAVALQSAELRDAQRNFFTHATEIMVMALDAHHGHRTRGGYHRVARYANLLARGLGIEDEAVLPRRQRLGEHQHVGGLRLDPLGPVGAVLDAHLVAGERPHLGVGDFAPVEGPVAHPVEPVDVVVGLGPLTCGAGDLGAR